jgi:hypothetical protein
MRLILIAMFMFQQGIPPTEVEKPITRTVLLCPKGYELWVREQNGFSGNKDGSFTLHYTWFVYNGEDTRLGDGNPTCFKEGYNPNDKDGAK